MASSEKKLITDSPLVIYKASAGSGKTFTLTLYYLWLLFSENKFEESLPSERNKTYRHILAVTFTNKATGEMKARIIKSLFNLASGREDGNSKIYANELIEAGCVKDGQELQKRSKEILYTLLHDYTNFNVSTIDTFFQRTMRAFVRDIGKQGGYNIELDSESMAKEAIDRMYLSLSEDTEENALKKWLLEYDVHQIETGHKWNSAEYKIRELSSELFKEDYKRWRDDLKEDELPTKRDIEEFNRYLTSEISKINEEWRALVYEGHDILKDVDVAELHKMGSSVLKYFISPTKDFSFPSLALRESTRSDWGHKKNSVSDYTNACLDAFDKGGYIQKLKTLYENKYTEYCMYNILQANIFSFGILSDVDSHLRDIIKERNVMLLSDTTDLLSKIINDTETPFIYEKTGVNIHHYMIDEFQDTSRSQWRNFLPLLKESISKGGHNLIVGDVKQSIYRWRNSDWGMLNGLPESEKYFGDSGAVSETMDVNWRSAPNVIDFNNNFFSWAVKNMNGYKNGENKFLNAKIVTAYNKNTQKFNDKKEKNTGCVKISFVSKVDDYEEEILKKLYSEIKSLLKNKEYSAANIAILCRWNREASRIAQYLMSEQKDDEEKFYVISNEALKVKNSAVVKSILAIMRYINSPEDDICKLMMNYELASSSSSSSDCAVEEAVSRLRDGEVADDMLSHVEALSTKSLYEMCEGIANMINARKEIEQIPYLQTFQDTILTYVGQNGSTLSEFLDWWDSHGDDIFISTPETNNAVRIMTIHKSKGLEFPTVFIPFCDWPLEGGADYIWKAPIVEGKEKWKFPLSVSSSMMESPYADDYLEEKALSVIDNLNVAYVAFTRAENNLIIYTPMPSSSMLKSQSMFSAFMYNTVETMISDKGNRAKFDGNDYLLGSLCLSQQNGDKGGSVAEISEYEVAPIESKLRLKLKGESYFDEHSKLSIGKIKHEMMSEVIVAEDVKRVAKKYERLGFISPEEAETFTNEVLSQIENNSQIATWFASGNKVLNESSVLNYADAGKISYRPDRVVINGDKVTIVDYKFGVESSAYIKQVESYISLLKKMGYFNVCGYVWYISLGKVV